MLKKHQGVFVILVNILLGLHAIAVTPDHTAVPYVSNPVNDSARKQLLDIYNGSGSGPRPVYLWSHNNGSNYQNSGALDQFVPSLTAAGFTVISWESVIAPATLTDLQTCWADAELALQWVKDNAVTYGFDASNIIIGGFSRGTGVSWKLANRDDAAIKGSYMTQAFPSSFWILPSFWTPLDEVSAGSKRLAVRYSTVPGSSDYPVSDPRYDTHDAQFGLDVCNEYDSYGIGDLTDYKDKNDGLTFATLYDDVVGFCQSAVSGPVLQIIDFTADDISVTKSMGGDFAFNESSPTLDSTSSAGYTGQPVYGGFEEEGDGCFWSATDPVNAGLKLRWNGGQGVEGEQASGLYLFRQAEFLNGMNSGSVMMDSAHDTVSGEAGYIPPGDGPENPAVSSTTFRFVLKDSLGYHISETRPLVSNQSFTFEAITLSYYSFTPSVNTSVAAGTIGAPSTPSFNNITWVGFRIDAVRGSKISQGANVGVELFSVGATTNSSAGASVTIGGPLHQKVEGFGASGAFWVDRLVDHDNSELLTGLLFNDLGLDIFRIRNTYGLDGGDSTATSTLQTIQLGLAAREGRPFKIMMSSWTPPASLKSTGSEFGSDNATLASDANGYRYADYADWWGDSLDYYRGLGIDPDYISMQNEPNWHPDYVGCGFDPTETTNFAGYNIAFEAVWQELAERYGTAGMPKMLGPETISFNKLADYIDNLAHPSRMYAYAQHYYQADVGRDPDALNALMAEANADYGYKPLFQTEYAVLDANTNSPMTRKLNLARLMHNALTVHEVSVYCYWALYWGQADKGTLIEMPTSSDYTITPEYYAFKHYSAFINSDWRRIDAQSTMSGLDISAYVNPDRSKLTVVLINENSTSIDLDISFPDLTVTSGEVYQSTEVLNCADIGSFDTESSLSIPGESLTTLSLNLATNAAPENPNILMIAIDDLLPQTRSYGNGQMITPNLDQLALDGYQFNRAYVQEAVCGPSRASIMTGLRPDSTKAYDYNSDFRDTIPWAYTIPQMLSRQGYYSAAIGKIFHVIDGENDSISWDEPWIRGDGRYGSTGGYAYENTTDSEDSLMDGAVAAAAVEKIAQLKNQQPFFYGVGFVRPHLPFVAPSAYWDLYDPADLELPSTDTPAVNSSSYAYTTWPELRAYTDIPASGPVSEEQEQNLIHGYYACVSFVDAQLGRLMDALEAEGLADNTIVILWGDHGWHLGDHGQWTKHTNFERATRIPLIIKVPWMPGASQVDALVEALDIYPTLLDLCGVAPPDYIQGDSLLPFLQNPDAAGPAEAVSQYPRNNEAIMGYSMRTDRYRYVEWRQKNLDTPVDVELYDHFLDPGEDTNAVSFTDPSVLAALSAQLDAYIGDDYRASTNAFLGNQLVTDGEFNSGMAYWTATQQNGAAADFNVLASDGSAGLGDDPLIHMDPINAGTGIWEIALEQVIGIESGKSYTIQVSARAESPRDIKILWRNKNNTYLSYYDSGAFPVSTGAQTYQFINIEPQNLELAADPDAELRIQIGGDSADVWIDSVGVYEQSGAQKATFGSALMEAGLTGEDALLNADADGDSVINLIEYACNMNMNTNDLHVLTPRFGTSGLPTHQIADTNSFQALELEYVKRRGASDLQYLPEFTDDLVNGEWSGSSIPETAQQIDTQWDRITVRDSETTETSTTRFGRILIKFNP